MDADTYMCFADLQAHEVNDTDYRISLLARDSRFLIAAVHGGGIEPGTSQVARGVAGEDHSLYLFEGLKSQGNGALHITAHRFDEPSLLQLLADRPYRSVVMAIHGASAGGAHGQDALVGGQNARLRGQVIQGLLAAGFKAADAHPHSPNLTGANPLNICNRGNPNGGVQIELSRAFRDSLFEEGVARGEGGTPNDRFTSLCEALRQALAASET